MKTGCRIHEEGFTLIEVMIALVIFSVGILGIGQMQIAAIQGNYSAHQFHEALTVAQNKIDTLKSLPYDTLLSGFDGDGKYTLFWNIAVDEPVVNAKKIRMIVRWQDHSISRRIALDATIISE